MRLAKIKLAGFKSFVDPMTVLTPGSLVGVVGPNGCGKSNIIDAVRWVLGESKASALRGDSMQDVIFGGSTSRKPVARASVELFFDNASGKAGGQWSQYAEIAVRRVLTRDGESSYWINNLRVRRRDVVDLFLGTGLGPRAYAIIEQGTISRVIEARPEDLRMFLEEAAGITKYKERRRETETRLKEVRENLSRVGDIRSELEVQVGRLEAQAALALRYRELSDSLRQRQNLLWFARRMAAAKDRAGAERAVAHAQLDLDAATARLRENESRLESARERHQVANEALQTAQAALYAASAEVARLEAETKHQEDLRRRIEQRLGQLHAEHLRLTGEIEQTEQRAADQSARLEALAAEHDGSTDLLEEARARLHRLEEASSAARAKATEAMRALAAADQALKVREVHRSNAQRNLQTARERMARLEADLRAMPEVDGVGLADAESSAEQAEEAVLEAEAMLESEREALGRWRDVLRVAQEHHIKARGALAELEAQQAALERVQRAAERPGKIGAWLVERGLNEARPLWQALAVEPGWERAVESALGRRFRALRADSSAAAGALDTPPPEALALAIGLPGSSEGEHAPDSLLGRVRCEVEEWLPHLGHWLGPVRGVVDLSSWLTDAAAVTSPPERCVVDAGGNMWMDGVLYPYVPDAAIEGALARRRELGFLAGRVAQASDDMAQAEDALDVQRLGLEEQESRAETAREALDGARTVARNLRMAAMRLVQESERVAERMNTARNQLDEARATERREQDVVAADDTEIERLTQAVDAQRQAMGRSADESRASERELQEAREGERLAAERQREVQYAMREASSRFAELGRHRDNARGLLVAVERELAERTVEADALVGANRQEALQVALTERQSREQALAAGRNLLEGETASLRALDEERMRLEQALGPLRDRIHEFGMKAQAAELAEGQMAERLKEAGADVEQLASAYGNGVSESALQAQITRFQSEIGAMGAVNLAAVEELRTTLERKTFLDAQSEDLTEALVTLEGAIRRIDRETREQLASTFEFVNERFGRLFPELFGGGQAMLILTGEDILGAGVQVSAQPPGKKTSNIHLLSGGEKALTAVALVFAMFQLNPAPFCMLDEVDAPLDDSNTGRFCRMLQKMCSTTQFLFITHSKITMEIAQQLIGVTMQESGVSRIVEVDVEQAVRMHAEEAA